MEKKTYLLRTEYKSLRVYKKVRAWVETLARF
jgi:hypothetical protein